MMIKPTLDELLEKVDTKYTLVILSSKIAREITTAYLEKGRQWPLTRYQWHWEKLPRAVMPGKKSIW